MTQLDLASAFSKFGSPLEAAAWMSQHLRDLIEQFGLPFIASLSNFVAQLPDIAVG